MTGMGWSFAGKLNSDRDMIFFCVYFNFYMNGVNFLSHRVGHICIFVHLGDS